MTNELLRTNKTYRHNTILGKWQWNREMNIKKSVIIWNMVNIHIGALFVLGFADSMTKYMYDLHCAVIVSIDDATKKWNTFTQSNLASANMLHGPDVVDRLSWKLYLFKYNISRAPFSSLVWPLRLYIFHSSSFLVRCDFFCGSCGKNYRSHNRTSRRWWMNKICYIIIN